MSPVIVPPPVGRALTSDALRTTVPVSPFTLSTAPASGDTYFAVVMGSTVNIGTPSDNTVDTDILQNSSVSTVKIQNDAVTSDKLADDASTDANRAVDTNHIKNNAVETRCINNGAVTFDKLGSLSVGVSNIQPDSVTEDKLSDHVSNDSLRAVNTNHIKDSAVTDAKIVSVSSSKLTGALPALDGSALTGLASAEVYGFHADANGHLQQTTTNGGADNISASTYAAFEQVLLTASGIIYSVNTNGNLIVTI